MTLDIISTPVLSVPYIIPLASRLPFLVHVELGVGFPVTSVNAVMIVFIPDAANTLLDP